MTTTRTATTETLRLLDLACEYAGEQALLRGRLYCAEQDGETGRATVIRERLARVDASLASVRSRVADIAAGV